MFYKYKVSFWLDCNLNDSCGIVFGRSMPEAIDYLTQWYSKDCISDLTLSTIDLDTTLPVLDMGTNYDALYATIEAVEQ